MIRTAICTAILVLLMTYHAAANTSEFSTDQTPPLPDPFTGTLAGLLEYVPSAPLVRPILAILSISTDTHVHTSISATDKPGEVSVHLEPSGFMVIDQEDGLIYFDAPKEAMPTGCTQEALLSEDEARRIAVELMQHLDISASPGELYARCQGCDRSNAQDTAEVNWLISYDRTYKGFRTRSSVVLIVSCCSRRVVHFSKQPPLPAPDSLAIKIDSAKAERIARDNVLVPRNWNACSLPRLPSLLIVPVDPTIAPELCSPGQKTPRSRLCWSLDFDGESPAPDSVGVCVDAETGKVIAIAEMTLM